MLLMPLENQGRMEGSLDEVSLGANLPKHPVKKRNVEKGERPPSL